jgi:hypothetical protein
MPVLKTRFAVKDKNDPVEYPLFHLISGAHRKNSYFSAVQLDYHILLDNIKRRRFDEAIRDVVLTPSFANESIPAPVRYAMESMQEIDSAYAYKVYGNARPIQESIQRELMNRKIRADFRYIGALRIETHIRLYGEIDLLCILPDNSSHQQVFGLGQLIREVASKQSNLQSVDYSDGVRIRLVTQKPVCRINIIPCSWITNAEYGETRIETHRGIVEYNFKEKTRKKYLPFLNMARVNNKDLDTHGNFKMIVRLLRSLSVDESISLNTYELTGLMYGLDNTKINAPKNLILAALPNVSNHIGRVVSDKEFFQTLLSPSEKELVFGNREGKRDAAIKLKNSLDGLIADLTESLGGNLKQAVNYPAH